jgi:hypothetical protein
VLVVVVMVVMGLIFLSPVGHLNQDLFGVGEGIGCVMACMLGVAVLLVVSVVVLSLFPHINIKMINLINDSKNQKASLSPRFMTFIFLFAALILQLAKKLDR